MAIEERMMLCPGCYAAIKEKDADLESLRAQIGEAQEDEPGRPDDLNVAAREFREAIAEFHSSSSADRDACIVLSIAALGGLIQAAIHAGEEG